MSHLLYAPLEWATLRKSLTHVINGPASAAVCFKSIDLDLSDKGLSARARCVVTGKELFSKVLYASDYNIFKLIV